MRFVAYFEIQPSSKFGLPYKDKTVIPEGSSMVFTIELHKVWKGHGTLPRYRDHNEAFSQALDLEDSTAHFRDNHLSLFLEADSLREAQEKSFCILDGLFLNLSLISGIHYYYKPIQILNFDTDEVHTLPLQFEKEPIQGGYMLVGRIEPYTYNLETLREQVKQAGEISKNSDQSLHKALTYYHHALYLLDGSQENPMNHQLLANASAFLNFWKAITTIIGDSSENRESYYSKYKTFGISEDYFTNNIEPLRKLRNRSDVAHYDLGGEGLKEIASRVGEALAVASFVLKAYRDTLLKEDSGAVTELS